MPDKRTAARHALAAHDDLLAVNEREPDLGPHDAALPRNEAAWLEWKASEYDPAYVAWSRAMDELAAALGEPISRHPINFRPVCEGILAGG